MIHEEMMHHLNVTG